MVFSILNQLFKLICWQDIGNNICWLYPFSCWWRHSANHNFASWYYL